MDFNYAELKGRIVARYGTQTRFAKTLNVSNMTVSRKLAGVTPFTREEILKWAAALGIPKNKITFYFFS